MLIRALKQHFEETGSQDGLLLHRNIDVHSGDGSLLIKLREDVTCPNHHNILVTKVCTRYYKYVYSFREYIMHFFLITNLIIEFKNTFPSADDFRVGNNFEMFHTSVAKMRKELL